MNPCSQALRLLQTNRRATAIRAAGTLALYGFALLPVLTPESVCFGRIDFDQRSNQSHAVSRAIGGASAAAPLAGAIGTHIGAPEDGCATMWASTPKTSRISSTVSTSRGCP
jgi:hypothetical protein